MFGFVYVKREEWKTNDLGDGDGIGAGAERPQQTPLFVLSKNAIFTQSAIFSQPRAKRDDAQL